MLGCIFYTIQLLIFPRLVRPNVTVHRYVEPAENGAHNDSDQLRFNVVEQDVLTLDLVVSTNESMYVERTVFAAEEWLVSHIICTACTNNFTCPNYIVIGRMVYTACPLVEQLWVD